MPLGTRIGDQTEDVARNPVLADADGLERETDHLTTQSLQECSMYCSACDVSESSVIAVAGGAGGTDPPPEN
eukprot:9496672-Pyramimonas_sp.AAC.1